MRIALDTFGPYDLNTLGEVVRNLKIYDDDDLLYVRWDERLTVDTPALVFDGSDRAIQIRDELQLVEWGYVDLAKEMIEEACPEDSEPSLEKLVDVLNPM
jgi:hypothetical protein